MMAAEGPLGCLESFRTVLVPVCVIQLPETSTKKLKNLRKSTPMIGKVTAARRNPHWKGWLAQPQLHRRFPPALDRGPCRASQLGASRWCFGLVGQEADGGPGVH